MVEWLMVKALSSSLSIKKKKKKELRVKIEFICIELSTHPALCSQAHHKGVCKT
jgi:hypothetical protein